MAVILYDGFYTNTDFSGHIGGTTPSAQTDQQRYNARKIYNYFHALGWTDQAIAGMLGNMAQESWLDPANLTPTGGRTWPQSNQQMMNYSGALGLVQWHSRITAYIRFCERYGIDWASGNSQLFRMKREMETEADGSYHWWKPGQYMGQHGIMLNIVNQPCPRKIWQWFGCTDMNKLTPQAKKTSRNEKIMPIITISLYNPDGQECRTCRQTQMILHHQHPDQMTRRPLRDRIRICSRWLRGSWHYIAGNF